MAPVEWTDASCDWKFTFILRCGARDSLVKRVMTPTVGCPVRRSSGSG